MCLQCWLTNMDITIEIQTEWLCKYICSKLIQEEKDNLFYKFYIQIQKEKKNVKFGFIIPGKLNEQERDQERKKDLENLINKKKRINEKIEKEWGYKNICDAIYDRKYWNIMNELYIGIKELKRKVELVRKQKRIKWFKKLLCWN